LGLIFNGFTKRLARVSEFLVAFGPFGLFVVALLDSTFLPLPTGVDALVILLTTANPRWMILYAVIATFGSTLGCWILYTISRRAGKRALNRFSEAKQARVKELIDRYDALAVLVVCLLPPPFPFKIFVVSAGVFRFHMTRFIIAIICGRLFRFLLIGYFAMRYGSQAKALLGRYYPWIGLSLALLIVAVVLIRNYAKRKPNPVAGLEA
jgi:membrane protein YqaA with SNARE-associated domain